MKLFERLGIKSAGDAAVVTLHEYLSNRSVALLLRGRSGGLDIGSGIAIEIAGHRLVATVAHNVRGLQPTQIDVMPAGRRLIKGARVRKIGTHPLATTRDIDVAWLELDCIDIEESGLAFILLNQVMPNPPKSESLPCFIQGYPAEMVDKPPAVTERPLVESDGFLTLSIPSEKRQTPHQPEVDVAVEYPPHDASLEDHGWPPPPGISGGGFWLFPSFASRQIWAPESAKLIGLARGWWKKEREFLATRIEHWLELVAEEFPETPLLIRDALASDTKPQCRGRGGSL
jgi:hypothetical protein